MVFIIVEDIRKSEFDLKMKFDKGYIFDERQTSDYDITYIFRYEDMKTVGKI